VNPIDDATPEDGGPGLFTRLAVPIGLVLGCVVFYGLTRFFGVPVEIWTGVDTFTRGPWMANVALVPAVSGFVAGFICGRHGKWYGMVPVALVHPLDYFRLAAQPNPDAQVLGVGLFVFFMIVMLELGLMAGWGGEILRGRLTGKDAHA
jgi:hypothetical protein